MNERVRSTRHRHNWVQPWDLLGGNQTNPGVWDQGGVMEGTEVCGRCGRYKEWWFDLNEARPPGQRATIHISYRPADAASLAWLRDE